MSETKPRMLTWRRSGQNGSRHELTAGRSLIASLEMRGSTAIASSGGDRWRFERDLTRRVRIWHESPPSRLLGEISRATWRGDHSLTVEGGETYAWAAANLWRSRWRWSTAAGVAIEYSRGRGDATVTVMGDLESSTIALLAAAARYLSVLSRNDDGIAAAAAVVGSMPPP